MVRQRLVGWTTAVALGLLLLAPVMAHAQRRGGGNMGYPPVYGQSWGYGPGVNYGYGYNPYFGSSGYTVPQWTGYTNPYAYGQYNVMPGYSYPSDQATLNQQSGVTQAMYMSGNAPAYVRIIVPTPDAQIFFGDASTQQTGSTVRDFVSPPLEPGKQFQYEIRTQWKQGDQTKDEKRTVDVQAGSRVLVNFAQPQGNQPMPNTQQLNQPSGTRHDGTENQQNNRPRTDNQQNNRPGGTENR
jgi:uncharacterized protein (TIGR03000 family)